MSVRVSRPISLPFRTWKQSLGTQKQLSESVLVTKPLPIQYGSPFCHPSAAPVQTPCHHLPLPCHSSTTPLPSFCHFPAITLPFLCHSPGMTLLVASRRPTRPPLADRCAAISSASHGRGGTAQGDVDEGRMGWGISEGSVRGRRAHPNVCESKKTWKQVKIKSEYVRMNLVPSLCLLL